jgi:Rrf2 family protein
MKVSRKGLYALQALMHLARRYPVGAAKIREIARDEDIPEKFLELILLDLKAARYVESERGRSGGYRLRRPPARIVLGDVVRAIDGPLAPFGDAQLLRKLIIRDPRHSTLFQLFLDVRNAVSRILDKTTLADLMTEAK